MVSCYKLTAYGTELLSYGAAKPRMIRLLSAQVKKNAPAITNLPIKTISYDVFAPPPDPADSVPPTFIYTFFHIRLENLPSGPISGYLIPVTWGGDSQQCPK